MVQCGVPAVIEPIPAGITQLSHPSRGIPETFTSIPAGNPRIPPDSRHPIPMQTSKLQTAIVPIA